MSNNIYLLGNPNTGKTTLFNQLTGLSQKTGNYAGVTVDLKRGAWRTQLNNYQIIDTPGCYSLSPNSEDEEITVQTLEKITSNDLIFLVVEAAKISRSLELIRGLNKRGLNYVLVLNMYDLLEFNGKQLDLKQLEKILGVPVVPVNSRIKKNFDSLEKQANKYFGSSYTKSASALLEEKWNFSEFKKRIDSCTQEKGENKSLLLTKKIDNYVTHPIFGYVIFFLIMFFIFQLIFSWSGLPMDLIDTGFVRGGKYLKNLLPVSKFTSLLVDGIFSGIGGIFIFIPQILFLLFFTTFLEQTGYMSRVSFLMDRGLSKFGLSGKSVIPLMSGLACAIPAVMSTRSISSRKERLITIMIAPLISCSARLPVYVLLIALLVDENQSFMGMNIQGLILFLMYLVGFVAALLVAKVMQLVIKIKSQTYTIIELPAYKLPLIRTMFISLYHKLISFIFGAGKVILLVSVILWVLMNFSPGDSRDIISRRYEKMVQENKFPEKQLKAMEQKELLETSYLVRMGKNIEYIIRPLGYDWKIGIALITSFAAREVFVSTMYTIYSISDSDSEEGLIKRMQNDKDIRGNFIYTKATVVSLILFYAFAMQCMSTMAVVYSETKSMKWVLIQFFYMFLMAYGFSFLAYQLLH